MPVDGFFEWRVGPFRTPDPTEDGLECRHTPTGGLFDFRLSLAFLGWRRCGWIAALINRSTSGLIRYGNGVAFGFRTRGAYGCAGSAGCIGVGRMRDAES